jgi:hypothetical protein
LVTITRTPKKIIHRYKENISFTAIVEPLSMSQGLVYEWAIDGRVDYSSFDATFTTCFTPAATVNERRKDYKISVRVGGYTAETIVCVAQNVNVGTINMAQSNKGMDTLGWTDTTPVEFDTTLTADEDIFLQNRFFLTRQVRRQTLSDGKTQYGRLQHSSIASDMDMTTTGFPYRKAALVITHPRAFKWNREEFEAMLAHELRHCEHRQETTDSSSIWKQFLDQNQSLFLRLTETLAYFEYVRSQTVSYKFLRDNNVLFGFIKNDVRANRLLDTLTETTQTQAKAILQKCYYNEVQYFELRETHEATLERWDYHIDPP